MVARMVGSSTSTGPLTTSTSLLHVCRRVDPFRYRLPNEDDEDDDRGELPPLKPLFGEVEVKPR
jgi:hypothetical protein